MSFSMTSTWSDSAIDRALAAIAFLVTVAIWPGISGFAIAPRWAVIAAFPMVALFFVKIRMTPVHWVGLAFFTYATVSLLWSPVFVEALQGWAELVILAVAFCLGAEAKNLKWFYAAVAFGVSISAVIAALQVDGIETVERVVGPAGLFANKNMMGEIAALALIGVVASGLWIFAIGPLVALGVSTCAGAMFGVVAAAVYWLWSKSAMLGIAAMIAIVLGGMVLVASSKNSTFIVRGRIWVDAIENLRWFGHGVGSYWVATPEHAPRQEAMNVRHWHAHNDAVEMVFDFGLGSVLFFGMVWLCLLGPASPDKYVLIGIIGVGMWGFPLFTPATGFVGAVCAGRLARRWADLRESVAYRPGYRSKRYAGAGPVRNTILVPAKWSEAVSFGPIPERTAGKGSIGV